MTPPPHPTALERLFAGYEYPILLTTFATQVGHYQYMQRTQPAVESAGSVRLSAFPRPLRAGLLWAVVFTGLLTKITLSKKAVRNHFDPVIANSSQRKQWAPSPQGSV